MRNILLGFPVSSSLEEHPISIGSRSLFSSDFSQAGRQFSQ
jgi:hypothetical protein